MIGKSAEWMSSDILVKLIDGLRGLLNALSAERGLAIDYSKLSLMDACEQIAKNRRIDKAVDLLDRTVFPSEEKTIAAFDPHDEYGGAHSYVLRECFGFENGQTKYADSAQVIQFIQKKDDGTVIRGLQSEQLVIALIDRQKKLNARFPSTHFDKAIKGLEMFLEAQRERVEERMQRAVMGELKK